MHHCDASFHPLSSESRLSAFSSLTSSGVHQIDAGFPAASESSFSFVRALIDRNLIPAGAVLAVSTKPASEQIRLTFEAVRGAENVVIRLLGCDDSKADLQAAALMHELAHGFAHIRFAYSPCICTQDHCLDVIKLLSPAELDLSALTAANDASSFGAAQIMSDVFGYHLPPAILPEFNDAANAEAKSLGRDLEADEVFELFERSFLNIRQPYALSRAKFYEEAVAGSSANVTHFSGVLSVRGNFVSLDARGNGPIDAFFSALKQAGIEDYSFISYHEHAISRGADSQAVAYIQLLAPGGVHICGVGIEHNINFASVKGILSAINRFENIRM